MTDIHTHALPGVDDGSTCVSMSLDMLREASASGAATVVCTPHVLDYGASLEPQAIRQLTAELQLAADAAGIAVRLVPGAEVMIAPDLAVRYKRGELQTLGGSQYMLIDLPMGGIPVYTRNILFELMMAGVTPILAHPERNAELRERPERLLAMSEQGVFGQVDCGSLAGLFGAEVQSFAFRAIEAGQAQFVASDGHNTGRRRMIMSDGLLALERHTGAAWPQLALDNPNAVLAGQELPPPTPSALRPIRGLWARMFGRR